MTREEAIKIFNTVLFFGKCDCPKEEIEECLKMAIEALEQEPTTKNDLVHNLCDSCTNIGCEFQSGIVRTKCAFYMPPQLEPDNCGNYVVQKPTTKNDLGVDCISRAEMLRYQRYLHGKMPNEENHKLWKFIKDLPSVTPQEPKKGHWIYLKHNKAKCSECDDVVLIAQTYGNANYCPNCGIDMRGEEN